MDEKKSHIYFFGYMDDDFCVTEFGKSVIENTNKVVGPYARKVYFLHIVFEGVCHFSGFDVEEKCAFLISRDKCHTFSVGPNYAHYWIGFTGKKAKQLLEFFNISTENHEQFSVKNWDYVKELLDTSFEKCAKDNSLDQAFAQSTLFSVLLRLVPYNEDTNKKRYIDDMEIVAQYIKNNYHQKISMQYLANAVHISPKYLRQKFHSAYGVSPQQYMIDIRMEAAKKLLLTTNYKIKEISASVGYASQLDFSNIFKKKTGLSPREYRVQNTIGGQNNE